MVLQYRHRQCGEKVAMPRCGNDAATLAFGGNACSETARPHTHTHVVHTHRFGHRNDAIDDGPFTPEIPGRPAHGKKQCTLVDHLDHRGHPVERLGETMQFTAVVAGQHNDRNTRAAHGDPYTTRNGCGSWMRRPPRVTRMSCADRWPSSTPDQLHRSTRNSRSADTDRCASPPTTTTTPLLRATAVDMRRTSAGATVDGICVTTSSNSPMHAFMHATQSRRGSTHTTRSSCHPASKRARALGAVDAHHATHAPDALASANSNAVRATGAAPVTAHIDPRGKPPARPAARNASAMRVATGIERSRFRTARDNVVTLAAARTLAGICFGAAGDDTPSL